MSKDITLETYLSEIRDYNTMKVNEKYKKIYSFMTVTSFWLDKINLYTADSINANNKYAVY